MHHRKNRLNHPISKGCDRFLRCTHDACLNVGRRICRSNHEISYLMAVIIISDFRFHCSLNPKSLILTIILLCLIYYKIITAKTKKEPPSRRRLCDSLLPVIQWQYISFPLPTALSSECSHAIHRCCRQRESPVRLLLHQHKSFVGNYR